jgi:outer membrane receptor for ferric coprogen and ferric-rhodotorulic acid
MIYNLDEHYSRYASYIDMSQSSAGAQREHDSFMAPADRVDLEAGSKGEHGLAVADPTAPLMARLKPQRSDLPNGTGLPGLYQDTQDCYSFVTSRAGYQIHSHWRTALTVNNVFERSYYHTIAAPNGIDRYGEPRSFFDGRY